MKYKWIPVNLNAPFAPRDGAGLLSFKGKLWLLGGWNPKDKVNFPSICNSEVWSSEDGLNWTLEIKEAPWEGRHTAGYVVHDQKMWIVGGDCIQGRYQPDVWCSENGKDWELVSDNVPWGQRVLHHTVAFKGKIWVMGGQTVPGFVPSEPRTIYYNDVWCSEDGKHWDLVLEHAPWVPRGMIGNNAVLHDRIWLLGGGTYDTPEFPVRKYYNDVWSTEDGIRWELHRETSPWKGRQYHEIAAFDGHLWVMEGFDGVFYIEMPDGTKKFKNPDRSGNIKDVWYSPDGVHWEELLDTPWLPRHAASVTVHQDALWMVAGNNMTPDVWKLVRISD
ncbi:MAG: hypothetical protein GX082_08345 [Clostridiaceae bacterium]|nr:hypothetical protein [Clostridiaceae bacterium]